MGVSLQNRNVCDTKDTGVQGRRESYRQRIALRANTTRPCAQQLGEIMKNKRLDVQCAGFLLLDDSNFSSLQLLRFGCEKCKTHDEYCVDCTLKLYEVLNSEKYAEFYTKPEKERHEIFVTLENEWVAQHQNAQQSVHLTAAGVGTGRRKSISGGR